MGDIRICHFSSALTCVHKLLLPRQSESYWWWSPDRAKSPPHWLSLTHSCSPRLCRWETGEKNKTQTPRRRKYIWSDSHIAALRDIVDGKLGRETFSSGCCCLFQPPNFCRAMIKCQINHWHCHLTVSIGRTGKLWPKLWATTFETQAACLWAICCLSYMFSPSTMYLIYRKNVQIKIHKYTSTQVTNTQIYKYKGVHWSSTFTLNPIISNMPNCAIPWIQILKLIYWTQSEEGGTGLDKQQEICHLLSFSQCHTCNVVHNDNDSTKTTTTPTT